MAAINLKKILLKTMESEWAIAFREKRNEEILNVERQDFSLIKNTLRYWCADPFLVEEGIKAYVFFEAFDRLKRKGVIGYRTLDSDKVGKINIVIEEPFHLSYPFIYCESGSWYIIPETKDSNQIIRYQSKTFPDLWEKEKVLIDHIAAVDTTVFSFCNSNMKLFTYLFKSFNKGTFQMIQLKGDSQSVQYKMEDYDGRKRPAGKICLFDNTYYRPSQLCTRTYGEAIIFNRILCLTDDSYEETECKVLTVEDISLDRTVNITGIHTYNNSENWEVIDVEIRGFSIVRIAGLIPRIYHMIKRTRRKKAGI